MDATIKENTVRIIIRQDPFYGKLGLMEFLNKIWPLRSMPSTDSRFPDFYQDIRQHVINNRDWSLEELFFEKLNILHGDEQLFKKFLEIVVHPETHADRIMIERYVRLINEPLASSGQALRRTGYTSGLPLYELRIASTPDQGSQSPYNNEIPFYKDSGPSTGFPYFVLRKDNFNDFGYETTMQLQFHVNREQVRTIGIVKIMRTQTLRTWEFLEDGFTQLGDDFCSLGASNNYYDNIFSTFNLGYLVPLYALRDAAMFPAISDRFVGEQGFQKSLLRDNLSESMWRTVRFLYSGVSIDDVFKFEFHFKPAYSEEGVFLDFNFEYRDRIKHRIYAIIGKNGTGKTTLLARIARELSTNKSNLIIRKPHFGKVISISYSYFDKFDTPEANPAFSYAYCGLKKSAGMLLSEEELQLRFSKSVTAILEKGERENWMDLLSPFMGVELINDMLRINAGEFKYVENSIIKVREKLSSGQHILLYVMTELLAQIRENSLILFDEPETHLHPNAITELINAVLSLVEKYNSFCIFGTHSPLIIQCIQSRNVFVLNRLPAQVELQRLSQESFGENLTIITEQIFGTNEVPKEYLKLFEDLKKHNLSFDAIVELLREANGLPMNLNSRLQLKNLYKQR